jgi:lipopolysaccharide export system protein LptA
MFLRFLALITLFAFAIYWFHIRKNPHDALAYENLIQESIDLRTRRALEEKPAHQKRQDVQKDIWTQNETRHFQIQSKDSDLTISQKKDKTEAFEALKDIRCNVQNEFILTADEGIYTYPSHQFIAQKNCSLIQNENQIDGTRIHLDLVQEIVTYENPKGRLASGPLFTAKQLIWDKKANTLHLIDEVHIDQPDQFNLVANLGTVFLSELQPTLITLEGNVRLISSRIQDKESYAVADTLTYNPTEKTLLFSAANKVLFWQEGLSLSASEILIRQDQTIEGHGDVHFAFDLEEQNYIDELFKQYL